MPKAYQNKQQNIYDCQKIGKFSYQYKKKMIKATMNSQQQNYTKAKVSMHT